MKKFLLALSAVGLVIIFSSVSFAYSEDEARDALITYSGTDAFADLLPEERRACMLWVSEGGYMNDRCRNAVTKLISEAPDVVSPSQRRALLAAASGRTVSSSGTTPTSNGKVVVKESDNTGSIIAAGIVGVIAGMIIHNNLPRDRDDRVYYPAPPPRYHHRPAPPHYRPAPPPHRLPKPVMRRNPGPVRPHHPPAHGRP